MRRHTLTIDECNQAAAMKLNGKTMWEVCRALNCTEAAIKNSFRDVLGKHWGTFVRPGDPQNRWVYGRTPN